MTPSAPLARWLDAFIRRPAWWLLLIAFWAAITALSFAWHLRDLHHYAHEMAALRGRLVFEIVETTRLWAAGHGGVYAPETEKTPSNPYLDVPEKDIRTPSGVKLTKINPAYMTRQLGELMASERDLRIHITSLKPIRPENAADDWEREALTGFEKGGPARISIIGDGKNGVFRYMAPLAVKKPCLTCHEIQGYKLGDVRGGISVTFPASYIYGIIDAQKRGYLLIHVVAFLLLSTLAWVSLRAIRGHVLALEATRNELVETEKMASLGRMVAGFAHEVNTPVGVAIGAVSQAQDVSRELGHLLAAEEVSEEALQAQLAMLDEASGLAMRNLNRAAGLVRSFKRTAVDQSSGVARDYDLSEVIEDVVRTLSGEFKATPIRIDVDCPRLKLHGDVGALEQILGNLLLNSRTHAFADGSQAGLISIRAHTHAGRVIIDYRDNGAGLSEAAQAHMFEPFFTTRRGSGGSGLGLYIVYNLVTQRLSGHIHCESTPGSGIHFVIDYPG